MGIYGFSETDIYVYDVHEGMVYKKTDEWYIEWLRVVQQVTTNNNEWYNEWQRVVQRVTTSDNEWYSKWKRMKANESDFRFQNETI